MHDLWPNDLKMTGDVKPPSTVLKEQAALLGTRTRNIVLAEVIRSELELRVGNSLEFSFYIVAPALGNYRYRLFTVLHPVVNLYPVNIFLDDDVYHEITEGDVQANGRAVLKAATQAEFEDILRKVFASSKTRQIINSLLALSDDTLEVSRAS